MSRVLAVDATVLTAFGDGLDPLWSGLLEGRSAIAPLERFGTERYISRLGAVVPGLAGDEEGSLQKGLLERLLAGLGPVPADCRVLTASTKGGIDTLEKIRRGRSAETIDLLLGALPQQVAERLGLTGDAGININAACASSTIAVARGAAQIAAGQADAVLVVGLDLLSEFVFSGFSALQALSGGASRPFDRNRCGLSLGEGGAAILLMSEARARREGRRALGAVLGWGAASDAHHITAPARDGCGLIDAVGRALDRAGLTAQGIAAVSAHGTGTVYNDLMELTAFRTLFGERDLPVFSVKGAIGHTLGAAGVIEIALCLRALAEKTVPPTVGLEEPEALGLGRVCATPQRLGGEVILSTNSGFGGINAAVVLGGAER